MEKTANCESKQTAATPAIANDVASRMSGAKLVKDGAGLTACTFIAALGNYGFQCVLGRHLPLAEYGLANAAFGAVFLLTLPVLAASSALIHYIARFRARGQEAHLRGLLAGARSGLLVLGVSGLLFTLVLVKPLTSFCDFPRSSLVIGIAIEQWAISPWYSSSLSAQGWGGTGEQVCLPQVPLSQSPPSPGSSYL